MPDTNSELIQIPGVGSVSASKLWEKLGEQILTVPGQDAGPVVQKILASGVLTEAEQVLLILIAVESLSSTTLMDGDLPHAR